MIDYRKCPDAPYRHLPFGNCALCGKLIPKKDGMVNRHRRWHTKCKELYYAASMPQFAYVWLKAHRGHTCAVCGREASRPGNRRTGLEVDHIIPLKLVPRKLRYWMPGNLQLLCHECHAAKTTQDRRAIRKAQQKGPSTAML